MAHTLFEVLTGHYQNGQAVGARPAEADLLLSIGDYLQRLLNARRETLPHLPHYGLPDVAAMFEALPYSLDALVLAVRQCIETFESRLTQVQVRPLLAPAGSGRLRLEISGRTHCGQNPKFLASFFSTGRAALELRTESRSHE